MKLKRIKKHISNYRKGLPFRILPFEDTIPYVNSVPFVDITAAAGGFSDLQIHSDFEWVELPFNITVKKGCFICKVVRVFRIGNNHNANTPYCRY